MIDLAETEIDDGKKAIDLAKALGNNDLREKSKT